MLFNSLEYLFYLPIVFGIYWGIIKRKEIQNVWVLLASYAFYAAWDYRFLGLIILSSAVDYYIAKSIHASENVRSRKQLLTLSIVVNLGILATFKYFDFFIDSANHLLSQIGFEMQFGLLDLIFPVGISFYTFQTLSYTIDVYQKRIEPTSDAISFFGFVSFFPQLVAGPIERAKDLLPQFSKTRTFTYATAMDGAHQILWGFFKKVVIADNAAIMVDSIFGSYEESAPWLLFLGSALFFLQVYGDFSGYSDIAIGTAKLFGFNLSTNFSTPFFSRSFSEFWRRWHITLNTWFRDYVYMPLGGNRGGNRKHIINIFIVFVLCGLWHGPAWTFILWGFVNAAYFLVEKRLGIKPENQVPLAQLKFPKPSDVFQMLMVFSLIALSLVFFRSENVGEAFKYFVEMTDFGSNNLHHSYASELRTLKLAELFSYVVVMLGFEWKNRDRAHGLESLSRYRAVRYLIYFGLTILTLQYFYGNKAFIYFQF